MWDISRWAMYAMLASSLMLGPSALAQGGAKDSNKANAKADEAKPKKKKVDPYREFNRANRLAAAGALTRSIPHYQTVLSEAPEQFPFAAFNLAEVYKAKKDCKNAVLLYTSFLALARDEKSKRQAKRAIRQCAQAEWGKLEIDSSPETNNTIRVDGYIVAVDGDLAATRLAPGTYEVSFEAIDHKTQTQTVTVPKEETVSVGAQLEMQTFFGQAKINVDVQGARVSLTPKKLDNVKESASPISTTSPLKEGVRLKTGKYFLEVQAKGYDRWIRNIYIRRDQETSVEVKMTRSLPAEIRGK